MARFLDKCVWVLLNKWLDKLRFIQYFVSLATALEYYYENRHNYAYGTENIGSDLVENEDW